jgi:TMEM175 potassium channel family protein
MMSEMERLTVRCSHRLWRLNNLYVITDKNGRRVRFRHDERENTVGVPRAPGIVWAAGTGHTGDPAGSRMPVSLSRGTMPDRIGLFEMRRLEALSNTIFGVAMTLLANDLPRTSGPAPAPGSADPLLAHDLAVPNWADLYHTYAQHVGALMLSFMIAGVFWLSQHRRLAFAPEAGRGTVFLNLFFLLSIIVLPATNGLLGSYPSSSVVAVLYGTHLTVIATLNALLWLIALRGRGHWEILAPAIFPVVVFVLGTAAATVSPAVGPYLWFLAFAAPLLGRLGAGRHGSRNT